MVLRRSVLFAALVLAGSVAAGRAQDKVEFGTRAPLVLERGDVTEVNGKLPADLFGTWLTIEQHRLSKTEERFYTAVQVYSIAKGADGRPVVTWFPFVPSGEAGQELGKARAAQTAWSPTPSQIDGLTAAMKAKPLKPDEDQRCKHILSAAGALPADLTKAPQVKGAKFVLQSIIQLEDRPTFGQTYYVQKLTKSEISGEMTMGAVPMNVVGVPMPIGTQGSFRWIKLNLPMPTAPAATAATPAPSPSSAPAAGDQR